MQITYSKFYSLYNQFQIISTLDLIILTQQYSRDNITQNYNPLDGNLTQTYNQTWKIENESFYGPFKGLEGISESIALQSMIDNDDSDVNANRTISSIIQIQNSNYYQADYTQILFTGKYYPQVKRGILQGIIIYKNQKPQFTINESKYEDYIMDPNYPWPGTLKDISQIDLDYYQTYQPDVRSCNFYYMFNLTEEEIDKKKNTYFIDYETLYDEYNQDSENSNKYVSASLSGYLISHMCATQFYISGPIYNNAQQTKYEAVYSSIFIILEILALISGIRFNILTNSPQRIQKLSLLSFLMQVCFDFLIGSIYSNFAIMLNALNYPIILLSIISYVYALFVDFPVVSQILMYDIQQNGRRHNLCIWIVVIVIIFTIFIFVQQYIPDWFYFILIILLSCYWLVQSIYAFNKDIKGPSLPFDYIAINYLIKFAPLCYFYGYTKNFMNCQVLSWYPYVIGVVGGVQLIIQIIQYFAGNRFGIKKSNYNQPETVEYDYEAQCLSTVALEQIEYLSKEQVLQYIEDKKSDQLIPLPYKQQIPPLGELTPDQCICMNPLHEHSIFYNQKYGALDLIQMFPMLQERKSALLKLQPEQFKCFVVVTKDQINQLFDCNICLENINILQSRNQNLLCLAKDNINNGDMQGNQEVFEQELNILKKNKKKHNNEDNNQIGIWITPCGHVYHSQCLCKWCNENCICPVDRQKIPQAPKYNWYE